MALIKFKPTSPGRRGMSGYDFEEITKSTPEKALVTPHKRWPGAITGALLLFAVRAVVSNKCCARWTLNEITWVFPEG